MKARMVLVSLAALLVPAGAGAATLLGLVTTGELFASGDGGATWTVRSTLPVRDAVALRARSSSAELFLASRSGVIYRSADAGVTWGAVGAVSASDVADLVARADGTLLLVTATGSVYASADLGATFTGLAALAGGSVASACAGWGYALYALARSGEISESLNGGAAWTVKGTIPISDAVRIAAVRDTLYVLTDTGDVYRSTDAAASWLAVGTLSQVGMTALAEHGGALVASTAAGEVATSVDAATWTWRGAINQLTVTALATDAPATGIAEPGAAGAAFALGAPRPNPARGAARASFAVATRSAARAGLDLLDARGRLVARRAPEILPAAGTHALVWDAGALPGGVYAVRLTADGRAVARTTWVVLR